MAAHIQSQWNGTSGRKGRPAGAHATSYQPLLVVDRDVADASKLPVAGAAGAPAQRTRAPSAGVLNDGTHNKARSGNIAKRSNGPAA